MYDAYIIRYTTHEFFYIVYGGLFCCAISYPQTASAVIRKNLPMISLSRILSKGGGLIGLIYGQYLLILLLIAAVYTDFKYDKINNGIILTGIVLGLFLRIMENGLQGICCAGFVILISFSMLYPLYRIGGLGAGDVKLLIMTGSFVPADMLLHIILYSFIIGAILSIGKMISEDNFMERMRYLLSYLADVLRTGQWKLYGENLNLDSHRYKSNKIHFALPVCISVMLGLGGII